MPQGASRAGPIRYSAAGAALADGKPHRYIFTVFMDVDKLPDAKDDNASAALVGFDLHFHTLDKADPDGDLQPLIASVGSLVSLTQRDVRAA